MLNQWEDNSNLNKGNVWGTWIPSVSFSFVYGFIEDGSD